MKPSNNCCTLVEDLKRMMFRPIVLATLNDSQNFTLVKVIRRALVKHQYTVCERGIQKSTECRHDAAK